MLVFYIYLSKFSCIKYLKIRYLEPMLYENCLKKKISWVYKLGLKKFDQFVFYEIFFDILVD